MCKEIEDVWSYGRVDVKKIIIKKKEEKIMREKLSHMSDGSQSNINCVVQYCSSNMFTILI